MILKKILIRGMNNMAHIVYSRRINKIYYSLPPDIENPQFFYKELNDFTNETSVKKPLNIYKIKFEETDKNLYMKCVDVDDKVVVKKRFKNVTQESTGGN